MKELPATVVILLLAVSLHVVAQARFTTKFRLATGQTIVLAEGGSGGRSTGSLSARLSEAAAPPDETTCFTSGRIHPREGVIEKVVIADVDDDPQSEIIIVARSTDTGGNFSAQALAFTKARFFFRAAADGLPPDVDPRRSLSENQDVA